jgi:hypothetical protein
VDKASNLKKNWLQIPQQAKFPQLNSKMSDTKLSPEGIAMRNALAQFDADPRPYEVKEAEVLEELRAPPAIDHVRNYQTLLKMSEAVPRVSCAACKTQCVMGTKCTANGTYHFNT